MIGGRTKKDIPLYLTGPKPEVAKKLGFWGGKVPLPHGPPDGLTGMKKNVEFLKAHREKVGPDFPLMVDCYMSLDVVSALRRSGASPLSTPRPQPITPLGFASLAARFPTSYPPLRARLASFQRVLLTPAPAIHDRARQGGRRRRRQDQLVGRVSPPGRL